MIYITIGLLFSIFLDIVWRTTLQSNPKYKLTIGQVILLILIWPICMMVFIAAFIKAKREQDNDGNN